MEAKNKKRRQKRHGKQILSLLLAALVTATAVSAPMTVQAESYVPSECEFLEEKIVVDFSEKHGHEGHVRLYFLMPAYDLMQGYFNYTFDSDDPDLWPAEWGEYDSSSAASSRLDFAYRTRVENLRVYQDWGDSRLYFVEFTVIPGTYYFSTNYMYEPYFTLTADLTPPDLDAYTLEDLKNEVLPDKYPQEIVAGSNYIFAIENCSKVEGYETFYEDHIDQFVEFAKTTEAEHQKMTALTSGTATYAEIMGEGTDTEASESVRADSTETVVETTTEIPSTQAADQPVAVHEGQENASHKLSLKDIIILVVFFGGAIGIFVYSKKKKKGE